MTVIISKICVLAFMMLHVILPVGSLVQSVTRVIDHPASRNIAQAPNVLIMIEGKEEGKKKKATEEKSKRNLTETKRIREGLSIKWQRLLSR
ncbi:hypothetical protein PUN28_019569 [Cardiocondyla obscurior]|uniref:Secreted protein n=1 Tax=Cardiocondyla obscurior TaxID=286306 RepID=A0AAW2E9Z6_9HYME